MIPNLESADLRAALNLPMLFQSHDQMLSLRRFKKPGSLCTVHQHVLI